MVEEAARVGRRIASARERAQLTQQELGSRAGLERTVVAKIEGGHRGVGALELMRIAQALGQRLEWLLTDAPDAVVAHRTRLDPESDVAEIDNMLETLARHVDFVAAIRPETIVAEVKPGEIPQDGASTEALAEKARLECNLAPNDRVRDIAKVLGRVGLLVFSAPLGANTADAASTLLPRGSVALINSTNAVGRRRLAAAHELGHYVIQDDYTVDWRVADQSNSDKTETLLDRFARAFLAPRSAFSRFWAKTRETQSVRTSAVLAGSEFQIDMATLSRRVLELNLADSQVAGEIRSVRTTKTDILDHGLYAPVDLEGTTLPSAYAQSVLELYRSEKISAERAIGLLLETFTHEDLPPLPPKRRDEFWSLLR